MARLVSRSRNFEVEAAAIQRARPEAIVGINLIETGVFIAALLIGARKQNQPVQFLDRPGLLP